MLNSGVVYVETYYVITDLYSPHRQRQADIALPNDHQLRRLGWFHMIDMVTRDDGRSVNGTAGTGADRDELVRERGSAALLSPRSAGRTAGLLFLAAAFLTVVVAFLSDDTPAMLVLSALAAATGLGAIYAPWHRWPRSATMVLVVPALPLIVAGNSMLLDPWIYGSYFVLLFMWVGLSQPQWTTTKILPLAVAAYLAPDLWTDLPADALRSLIVVGPTWMLVGETMAWTAARIRRAELADVRRTGEMERLLAASVMLARQTDPNEAAQLVAGLATRLVGGTSGLVLLRDGRDLRAAGHHNWDPPFERLRAADLDPALREALARGDISAHGPGRDGPLAAAARGRPLVLIPLRAGTEPLGVVAVAFAPGRLATLDPFVADMAVTFATQVTLTFERLRSTRRLLDETRRDPLTRIGNRREADDALRRIGADDAVVVIDLDHFKRVNDERGHAEGDRVLVELAAFFQRFLSEGDTSARLGGEEFLVILKGVGAQAGAAVQRILSGWRELDPLTTFSAGVAVHREGDDPKETMANADQALYAAKRGGRDRVVVDGRPESDFVTVE